MARGILYVMETVVPGLIKIGKTGSSNFESRMYNLEHNGYYNVTGLKRRFAIEVDDYEAKEKLLDTIFSKSNVTGSELFAMDINLAVQLLSSFDGNVIYPKKETKAHVFDAAALAAAEGSDSVPVKPGEKTKSGKAKRFRFSMVGIPQGAILEFAEDPSIKVMVADDSHVRYQDKIWTLSSLARMLKKVSYNVQGTAFFTYRGKALTTLRQELVEAENAKT